MAEETRQDIEERMRDEQARADREGARAEAARTARVQGEGTIRVRIVHGKHHSADGVTHDTGHVIDVTPRQFTAFRDQFEPVSGSEPTHYEQEALDEVAQAENLRNSPAAHLAARRVIGAAGPGATEIPNRALARDAVTSSSSQHEAVNRHASGKTTEDEDAAAERQLKEEDRVREFNAGLASAARPANTPENAEGEGEEETEEEKLAKMSPSERSKYLAERNKA